MSDKIIEFAICLLAVGYFLWGYKFAVMVGRMNRASRELEQLRQERREMIERL